MGGWVVNATPRPLYVRQRDAVPIVQEAEWVPGPVWAGVENLALTGLRSTDCPVRSESLYRLSYSGPTFFLTYYWIIKIIGIL